MPDIILKTILPCAGILVILFCIGAYFFKYGATLKDSIQQFKMFGADLRISIITVFVLIGLIFIFAGTYFNIVDTNAKLTKMLDEEKEKSKKYESQLIDFQSEIRTLKLSQNNTIDYYLDLDGITNLPNPNNLKVCYMVWGNEDKEIPLKCTAITQNNQQRLQVTISDLMPGMFITAMAVEELSTGRKWKISGFFPLSPSLKLIASN